MVVLGSIDGNLQTARLGAKPAALCKLHSIQAHERLIIDLKTVTLRGRACIVSLGWDRFIKVLEVHEDGSVAPTGDPHQISTPGTFLEVLSFNDEVVVLVGRKESSLLDVLSFGAERNLEYRYQIALSDAEYSTFRFVAMCITGRIFDSVPLVAVATSQEPYMRIVLVSLANIPEDDQPIKRSQIVANFNNFASQDKYSEARIAWNRNGTGLWVFGDDGAIRGLELEATQD